MPHLAENRSSWLLIWLVLGVGLALVACTRASEEPLSGRVSLEYLGKSKSDTLFRLRNDSAQPIRFAGWSAFFSDPMPLYSAACRDASKPSDVMALTGPVARSHTASEPIELPSGKQLRLAIPNYDFQKFIGGRCRVSIKLGDASIVVQSEEFEP